MFVNGAWVDALSGAVDAATSPATGKQIGTVPSGDRADAVAAISSAREAAGGWARLSAFERAALLHRVADVIEGRRDELARTLTLDQGKPLRAEAYDEVDELVVYWRMAAEDGRAAVEGPGTAPAPPCASGPGTYPIAGAPPPAEKFTPRSMRSRRAITERSSP